MFKSCRRRVFVPCRKSTGFLQLDNLTEASSGLYQARACQIRRQRETRAAEGNDTCYHPYTTDTVSKSPLHTPRCSVTCARVLQMTQLASVLGRQFPSWQHPQLCFTFYPTHPSYMEILTRTILLRHCEHHHTNWYQNWTSARKHFSTLRLQFKL